MKHERASNSEQQEAVICRKCNIKMKPGLCLKNDTMSGIGDFNDADSACTVHLCSSGIIHGCHKCPSCGASE